MNTFLRQNHKESLTYLKAATYCFKKERVITGSILFFAVLLCFVGIFNRYLFYFFANIDQSVLAKTQSELSQIINLISGAFIITQIFVNTTARRTHRLGVGLMDRYDCYVYGLPANKVMLQPVSDSDIDFLSRKIKKNPDKYRNYYFSSVKEAEDKNAVFYNLFKLFKDEYKLMSYVKPYYTMIWVGFIIAIVVLAASFDDSFVSTLINTLIPSLSILSIIATSHHKFTESMGRLQNAISFMNAQEEAARSKDSPVNLSSASLLRCIQDGMFSVRLNNYNVFKLFIRFYERNEQKAQKSLAEATEKTHIVPVDDEPAPKETPKKSTSTRNTAVKTTEPVKQAKETEPTKKASEPVKSEPKPIPITGQSVRKKTTTAAKKTSATTTTTAVKPVAKDTKKSTSTDSAETKTAKPRAKAKTN